MGKYQWQLFIVIGFGWAQDNLWPVVTALILTPITNEFRVSRPPLLTLAQNIGLLAGAMFWGFGCDVFGRRWGFNLTLGVTGLWGMISASAPNLAAIGIFDAFWWVNSSPDQPVMNVIPSGVLESEAISRLIVRSSSNSFLEAINIFSPSFPSSGPSLSSSLQQWLGVCWGTIRVRKLIQTVPVRRTWDGVIL